MIKYKIGELYTYYGKLYVFKGTRDEYKRSSYFYGRGDTYNLFQNVKTGEYERLHYCRPRKAGNKIIEKILEKWTTEHEYKGLTYEAKYYDDCAKIGCQTIPKESLLDIANDILEFYGE